jgi:hypothetical protein
MTLGVICCFVGGFAMTWGMTQPDRVLIILGAALILVGFSIV